MDPPPQIRPDWGRMRTAVMVQLKITNRDVRRHSKGENVGEHTQRIPKVAELTEKGLSLRGSRFRWVWSASNVQRFEARGEPTRRATIHGLKQGRTPRETPYPDEDSAVKNTRRARPA